MSVEIDNQFIYESLDKAKIFNEQIFQQPQKLIDLTAEIVQSVDSPLMLSHLGIVITPRVWSESAKKTFVGIAQTSRLGLQKIANYLAQSSDDLAMGIKKNMLGGKHFDLYKGTLKLEAEKGISVYPYEVGRTDIINGGALEVNAACLDAPADLHDLSLFHRTLMKKLSGNLEVDVNHVPEDSVVELIVKTMLLQASANDQGNTSPVLAWLGTAAEIYGTRDKGGYWPRELRFKQIADAYLKKVGSKATFELVCIEQLNNADLVDKVSSAYRNLLPEDMETQTPEAIGGLCKLATTGKLIGSLTAELLTNKAAMAVITSPDLSSKAGIKAEEWKHYAGAFPPTTFLSSEYIWWDDEAIKLDKLMTEHRDGLYFKLSNGEEGHGVWPGEVVTNDKLKHFIELAEQDPYAVIVQKKLTHVPFEAVVVDINEFKLDLMQGETDMGTHFQLLKGQPNPEGNIVMTRFAPKNGYSVTTNSGGDGVFRPVATYLKQE